LQNNPELNTNAMPDFRASAWAMEFVARDGVLAWFPQNVPRGTFGKSVAAD
jgi:hypothetical protein